MMFEVITQHQPLDYQSLEILKCAYSELSEEGKVISTSKRIARAHVLLGQVDSAIVEYESILQRFPNNPSILNALADLKHGVTSPAATAFDSIRFDSVRFWTVFPEQVVSVRLEGADVQAGNPNCLLSITNRTASWLMVDCVWEVDTVHRWQNRESTRLELSPHEEGAIRGPHCRLPFPWRVVVHANRHRPAWMVRACLWVRAQGWMPTRIRRLADRTRTSVPCGLQWMLACAPIDRTDEYERGLGI